MDNHFSKAKFAFISHRNKGSNLEVALKLKDFLTSRHIDCWIDRHDLGAEEWRKQINYQLQRCSVFIIICNEDAFSSEEIKTEIHTVRDIYDRHEEITIFPVAIDNYLFDSKEADPVFLRQFEGEIITDLNDLETSFKKILFKLGDKLSIVENDKNDFYFANNFEELTQYVGKDQVVYIPDCVKLISRNAFSGNDYLEKVIIPDSVEVVEKFAFNRCSNLKDVDGMNMVKDIDKNTFYESPLMDKDVVIINDILLSYNSSDKCIKIPDGIRVIANRCFEGNEGIEEVVLPEGLEYIGKKAFSGCSNLSKINIPSSIKKIDEIAFDGAKVEKEIVFDDKYKHLF